MRLILLFFFFLCFFYRTEHLSNNINPTWDKFSIPLRSLCNGDLDRNIKVECYDHNKNGNHSLIGEMYLTARQLQMGPCDANVFDLINPKKKVKIRIGSS